MQKNKNVRKCKCAKMNMCENANVQIYKYTNIQKCK